MVEDDRVEPKARRLGERLVARRAAIDGDEKLRAALGERADRLDIRAVALDDPVGNMDQVRRAAGAQVLGEERRAAGAVDVVVAEDRDDLAGQDGVGEALGGVLHVAQLVRVRQEVAQLRGKEARHLVHGDAAPGEHPRRARRARRGVCAIAVAIGALRGVAAVEPGPAEGGAGHAEDGAVLLKREADSGTGRCYRGRRRQAPAGEAPSPGSGAAFRLNLRTASGTG